MQPELGNKVNPSILPRFAWPASLSAHLKDRRSPIDQFLRSEFPNVAIFLKEPRKQVRAVHANGRAIVPSIRSGYPYAAIGSAIDFRIRYYFEANEMRDAQPGLLRMLNAFGGRAIERSPTLSEPRWVRTLGWVESLSLPDASDFTERLTRLLKRIDPPQRRLEKQDEDELNRYCIALGYLDPVRRGFVRLEALPSGSAMELAARPQEFWLDDMRAMSWTFHESLGYLLTRPFTMNPGMPGLSADADMIVDGTLIEIKTSLSPQIHWSWLRQLLAYALLDTSDEFSIHSIAFYLPRQGLYLSWNLEEALRELSGEPTLTLQGARGRFSYVVEYEVREYFAELQAEYYEALEDADGPLPSDSP